MFRILPSRLGKEEVNPPGPWVVDNLSRRLSEPVLLNSESKSLQPDILLSDDERRTGCTPQSITRLLRLSLRLAIQLSMCEVGGAGVEPAT